MSSLLWPARLLQELPFPNTTTGWLADPQNAPWWAELRAGSGFNPFAVSGCVLYLDPSDPSAITLLDAAITDGAALDTGWSDNDVSQALNADGFGGTRFTVSSATAPTLTQTPTGCAVHATAMPPLTPTVKYAAGATVPAFCIETRLSSPGAADRTWFQPPTNAVGTVGSAHSGAAISAADANGYRTASVTVNSCGGTPTFRIRFCSADGVVTGASVGQILTLKDATVAQPRIAACANLSTDVADSFAQATVNNQPGYEAAGINGKPAIRTYGTAHWLLSAEAALTSIFDGTDKPWTLMFVAQQKATTGTQGLFGLRRNSTTTPVIQSYSSSGDYTLDKRDDANTLVSRLGGDPDTSPHVFEFVHTGTSMTMYRDGVQLFTGAQDVGVTTLDRMILHAVTLTGTNSANLASSRWAAYGRALAANERSYLRRGMANPYGISVAA